MMEMTLFIERRVMLSVVMLISFLTVTTEYDFKCPDEPQRIIRANWYCDSKQENYSCLLDLQIGAYRESCLYKSDFVRMGQKYVIKGKRRNANCSSNRYQPFKFYSTQLSECVFIKSTCSEEGQVTFILGSTTEDTKCGCKYKEGYTFLTRPRNIRFCLPDQEDCMCHLTICPENKILTSDYQCRAITMYSSKVPTIVKPKSKENEAVTNKTFESFIYNVTPPARNYRNTVAGICCTLVMLMILTVFFLHAEIWKTRGIDACLTYSQRLRGSNKSYDVNKEANEYQNKFKSDEPCNGKDTENSTNDATNEIPEEICNVNDIENSSNDHKTEDETFRVIAETIKQILSNKQKFKTEYVLEDGKCICFQRNEINRFIESILGIFEYVNVNEINIVEGFRVIKMVSDTTDIFGEQDIRCMQIPAVFLQHVWSIGVNEIVSDANLPEDLKKNIEKVKTNIKHIDVCMNNTENQNEHERSVEAVTKFVEFVQEKIHSLMKGKDIHREHEVNRVKYNFEKLINLYMNVQFLRSAYYIRYYSRDAPFVGDRSSLMYSKLNDIEETQKTFLRAFEKPTYDTVVFFALLNPSEYTFFSDYMEVKGIHLQDLSHQLSDNGFAIRPQKWPDQWVVMSKNMWGTIWGSLKPDDKPSMVFRFDLVNKVDNIFHIRSSKWPLWYVHMKETASLRGNTVNKRKKREWKIICLPDSKYMMCTQKWPCKFTYMKDATMREVLAAYGDPKESGYWDLISENQLDLLHLFP